MRRVRQLREHRDAVISVREKRRQERQKRLALARRRVHGINQKAVHVDSRPSISTSHFPSISFVPFDSYKVQLTNRPLKICHAIDSMGLGGGQTMLLELVHGLNNYFGQYVHNMIMYINPMPPKETNLFTSYGLPAIHMRQKDMKSFLEGQKTDILVQHRLMNSTCLKPFLPEQTKYILLNHTFHCLEKLPNFRHCDVYVSVCNFLNRKTLWDNKRVSPSRRFVILNGVESNYLTDIVPKQLEGTFKTGRCHRLVQSKFRTDSLKWMSKDVAKFIPGHIHYLIGTNKEAKMLMKRLNACRYLGAIINRAEKMSILKALDLYFYETFQGEGASIAILESLAAGVPVLCKDLGGNSELVQNGINGYIVKDRNEYLKHMISLYRDRSALEQLKQKTLDDFNKRLHIRHVACKYMQLFEVLANC